jgi:hypothetical protein
VPLTLTTTNEHRTFNHKIKKTWTDPFNVVGNGGLPLLNRLLWANIESLPQSLFNKLLTRYTSPKYLLRAEKDKLLRVHELNAKRKKPSDLNKRIIDLGDTTFHNSFHHEAFAFAKEIKNAAMKNAFAKYLKQLDEKMDTNRISP